jgi:hypothetical protein
MTTENDKANAQILLSADEAVAKKILDVLMKHPDVLRNAIKQMHMEDERRNQELRNQMYQQSVAQQTAMRAQGMRNAYINDNQGQVVRAQDFWRNVFGGKK